MCSEITRTKNCDGIKIDENKGSTSGINTDACG